MKAPDYHHVIKQPMDLGTMKYKLNTIQYKNSEEFIEDLQLIFTNCYTYNNEDADEYKYVPISPLIVQTIGLTNLQILIQMRSKFKADC